MRLADKRILLGISGGIAAYKSAELVRRLKDQGAEVRVVMTRSAKEFITPLTLQAVSGHAVADSLLDPAAEAGMGHIELAKWADLVLIAPASANLMARLAAGMADELLTTLCLATPAPVALAPAMNQQMYRNAATQANLATLASRGLQLWGPDSGSQACGDVGPGRMLDPLELVERCVAALAPAQTLAGLRLLLTAGPTREALDPVRYISNHSSGKMGFALARAAAELGAEVTLVSGPVTLTTPPGVTRVDVESAEQMHAAVMERVRQHDIFIGCAAVADYRPAQISAQKIKKTADNDEMVLQLVKNPDIIAAVGALANKPFTVGFAAETVDVEQYALDKLNRKRLDMIAANDVSRAGQGFNADDNALTVYWQGDRRELPLSDKLSLARHLLDLVADRYRSSRAPGTQP
ncbi:bifunctional phosphopantothenoylcysteine decarboxylase/phosphopantothenate--cysteine ligase CoaBC [Aeromonas simiae]|uniref:bifunctional phosphopantothenoylcysteine decarboxylase/phosphopantothenate--cysteine ligase CoaBC n=1 Tax=Aeromonas simiae TaxID=218936 RepID=UPI0005A9299C|nr:bifunctional phosphopantothenoylcysteine decarboxylase/phosphopantothenate--cysteine ligase CoaBC [Aeromonas simiae]MDO2949281.1 bifunctional phosphopantothenoylcysteine decarboxylase/phosphopantothenate--cysteine ligase CoaBC [Aeromonas simiae]MDO2952745.1 bifunctional phosphopantothenoylcysteine decarboxylase/phosphopantothenate--cysteine ligase CoaBC [Aeromonas simiae]MDO2956470.1 bifunctional phosphopantothenoylcysteine decarboxylase/phosphopantothenate--cysteine ligase CoaBC [Aeromonas s